MFPTDHFQLQQQFWRWIFTCNSWMFLITFNPSNSSDDVSSYATCGVQDTLCPYLWNHWRLGLSHQLTVRKTGAHLGWDMKRGSRVLPSLMRSRQTWQNGDLIFLQVCSITQRFSCVLRCLRIVSWFILRPPSPSRLRRLHVSSGKCEIDTKRGRWCWG